MILELIVATGLSWIGTSLLKTAEKEKSSAACFVGIVITLVALLGFGYVILGTVINAIEHPYHFAIPVRIEREY